LPQPRRPDRDQERRDGLLAPSEIAQAPLDQFLAWQG